MTHHSAEDRHVFLKQMQYSYHNLMLPEPRIREAREVEPIDWGGEKARKREVRE